MRNSKTTIAKIIEQNKLDEKVPIWLMRQAGRSLPEYRKVVEDMNNFMETCYNTGLVTKLTLQPIQITASKLAYLQ